MQLKFGKHRSRPQASHHQITPAILCCHPWGKRKDTLMQGQWSVGPDSDGCGGKAEPRGLLVIWIAFPGCYRPASCLVSLHFGGYWTHSTLPYGFSLCVFKFIVQSRDMNQNSAHLKDPQLSALPCKCQEWKCESWALRHILISYNFLKIVWSSHLKVQETQ